MVWRAALLSSYAVGDLLLAVSTGSARAEGAPAESRMAAVEVEIEVFSGRPNPKWTLSGADSAILRSKLAGLPKVESGARSDNLGYRGVVLRSSQGQGWTVHVHRGLGMKDDRTGTTFFLDRGRELEHWLVATGRRLLSPAVGSAVDADLRR